MKTVKQILFVPPAPIVWAESQGIFAKHGVKVETTQTLSSDQLGQGLADGTWDVGVGVVDNIIAWNDERKAGLQIIAQLERTNIMAFVSTKPTLEETAKSSIAVDSTTNGFVLVLYRALARAGIDRHKVKYDAVGGVKHRFDALAAGKATSAILVPPFIDMALAKGLHKVWDGADVAPAYPGVVVGARAAWLRQNEDAACAYVRALVEANDWAPKNSDAAVAALVAARYSEPAAKRLVATTVPRLEPSLEGWNEVVALRRECGLLPKPEPRAEDVINYRQWIS